MTDTELHEILDNEQRKLSPAELRQVIYELKQDCLKEMAKLLEEYNNWGCEREDYLPKNGFYNGEQNAFQIVLDLLEHLKGKENAND